MSLTTYERPRTLDEALALIAGPDVAVVSGGTDFYPERLYRPRHENVVDISAVRDLSGVQRVGDVWRIGAGTPWREVRDADLPAAFDGLRDAARQVGGAQIQNAGTVAGNICTASPAGDGIAPLLALDARVELRSLSGQRVLDLQDFLTGYRATALRPGELMTALLIPSPPVTARGSFVKFGQRSHLVISIVMVAALLDVLDDHVASARLVVGACSPVATRVPLLERALVDQPLTVTSIRNVVRSVALPELSPIDDVRATSAYRLRVVRELIVDAIVACWNPS